MCTCTHKYYVYYNNYMYIIKNIWYIIKKKIPLYTFKHTGQAN